MRLLEETVSYIRDFGEIVFIGSLESGYSCTWKEFKKLAAREYYGGHGGAEVCTDLVIQFRSGDTICRYDYDGKEGWDFDHNKRPLCFNPHTELKPIETLFAIDGAWQTLKKAHSELKIKRMEKMFVPVVEAAAKACGLSAGSVKELDYV